MSDAGEPRLPSGWSLSRSSETFDVVSDEGRRVAQSEYLPTGELPVVDQGEPLIGGYTNDGSLAYRGQLPVLVFGDHTRRTKYIDFRFAVGAQGVKLLTARPYWDARLLCYWMRIIEFPDRGYSRHFQFIRALDFPMPPSPEQGRIVDAIDSYFSRLDAAVASLEAAQTKLEAYRASVLKAAVEGRLVPTEATLARAEKRDFEPADVLLKRILSERQRRWEEVELAKRKAAGKSPRDDKAKYEEPKAPDTKGLPTLPQGWSWATVEQLASEHRGAICAGPFGTIFKAKDFRPTGIPIIQLRHVKPDRFLSHKMTYMDVDIWKALFRDDYSIFGGELLVTKLGDPPGDCAIYPASAGDSMLTPDVMKLQVDEALAHPRYVMHYINSPVARALTFDNAFGTTRLRLTLPLFRQMPIALPPRTEQERISEEIDRLVTVADAAGSQSETEVKRVGRLRQAILKWAFEGKLVDQDPNDEPAEKLLERIRAEGANTETPKRARRARNGQ